MRIGINAQLLSFSQTYRNGGISHYIYYLLQGLAQYSDTHTYIVFVNSTEVASALPSHPRITYVSAPWDEDKPWERILWEQMVLPSLIKKYHLDILHSPANVIPERIPSSCKSIVTLHDLAFLRFPYVLTRMKRTYHQLFTLRSLRRADAIIAVSESTKQDCVQLVHVSPSRIHTAYIALDPKFFRTISVEEKKKFREKHDLANGYILYFGTLEPRKNLPMLIEAFSTLRQTHAIPHKLVLAGGKGWLYDEIFAQIQEKGLEEHVLFPGFIPESERSFWFASASAFAYPSLYEGFGMPVVEALAYGIPTLTTNVSSLPEAAHNVAVMVDPGDVQTFTNELFRVLSEVESQKIFQKNAESVRNFFSLQTMYMQTLKVYELVGRHNALEKEKK